MKKRDRDIIDDLFQSKLQDFEVDVTPQDWEAIADRLPRATSIPFYRRAPFWAAAAVASLLMVMSGIYFFDKEPVNDPIAQEIERQTEEIKSRMEEGIEIPTEDSTGPTYTQPKTGVTKQYVAQAKANTKQYTDEALLIEEREDEGVDYPQRVTEDERPISAAAGDEEMKRNDAAKESPGIENTERIITADKKEEKTKTRRWGFGMGAGGVSVGSNNVVPSYLVTTMGLRSEDLMMLNASSGALPKTDIHHNKPLSFGVGISYYLNDRFSLQSGLTYTYLSSDWKTGEREEYKFKTEQKLHFIGIPLALTYKIAEWNRFMLYASAGVQVDMNVAGRQKGELMRDEVIGSEVRSVREKKLLLSANAKVGVSYPIFRFLSAYAEAGAGYYFDNGSALFDKMSQMPTIYSEKPFNLNLQAGFRLGF